MWPEQSVAFVDCTPEDRLRAVEFATHGSVLRTLAGKQKGYLRLRISLAVRRDCRETARCKGLQFPRKFRRCSGNPCRTARKTRPRRGGGRDRCQRRPGMCAQIRGTASGLLPKCRLGTGG